MDIAGRLSAIFTEGKNFRNFWFPPPGHQTPTEKAATLKERICFSEASIFILE